MPTGFAVLAFTSILPPFTLAMQEAAGAKYDRVSAAGTQTGREMLIPCRRLTVLLIVISFAMIVILIRRWFVTKSRGGGGASVTGTLPGMSSKCWLTVLVLVACVIACCDVDALKNMFGYTTLVVPLLRKTNVTTRSCMNCTKHSALAQPVAVHPSVGFLVNTDSKSGMESASLFAQEKPPSGTSRNDQLNGRATWRGVNHASFAQPVGALLHNDNLNTHHSNQSSSFKVAIGLDMRNISDCSEVPLPFTNFMSLIYAPKEYHTGDPDMAKWRFQRFADLMNFVSSDPTKYCSAISRLVRDGLRFNLFGVDFSNVVQKRGLAWTMDDDIKVAMMMYWGSGYQTGLSVVQVDYEMRYRPRDMNMFVYGRRDRFSNFFRDGYVKITDFGVDINKLKEEIRLAKGASKWQDLLESNTRWTKNMHFHALDPLMENKGILELVSFYMGSDVVVNGYQYWHADANATKDRVTTGHWHHDSCGTRVKVFLYIHDVDEDRMPTEIAKGSQTALKYTFGGYTIFQSQAVSQTWDLDRMMGPAGGGFIFDPNTIHRSFMDKPHLPRDVVVVDISSTVKNDVGIPVARGRPCPTHSWRTETVNSGFKYPENTFGPITEDLVKKSNGRKNWEEYYKGIRSKFDNASYQKFLEEDEGNKVDEATIKKYEEYKQIQGLSKIERLRYQKRKEEKERAERKEQEKKQEAERAKEEREEKRGGTSKKMKRQEGRRQEVERIGDKTKEERREAKEKRRNKKV